MEYKKCNFCWWIFYKKINESKKCWNNRHKFCSSKCKKESQKWIKKSLEECLQRRKYNWNKVCLNCWNSFISYKHEQKFCSNECSTKYSIWKKRVWKWKPWNKWLVWVFKHSKKSIEKMSLCKRWNKTHLWKWWITKLGFAIRNSLKNRNWKKSILERDWYACVECRDNRWWNLIVHHIKNFADIFRDNNIKTFEDAMNCDEFWDMNNWVTICETCHELKHPTLKIIWLWKCAVARNLVA